MTLERKIAKAFRLTDENWMKHANPWSVWTRYSVLPLIVFALWSGVDRRVVSYSGNYFLSAKIPGRQDSGSRFWVGPSKKAVN